MPLKPAPAGFFASGVAAEKPHFRKGCRKAKSRENNIKISILVMFPIVLVLLVLVDSIRKKHDSHVAGDFLAEWASRA